MQRDGMQAEFIDNLYTTVMWITTTFVALIVGSNMIVGTLFLPFFPPILSGVAGWIIVITILVGLVLAWMRR